MMRNGTPRIASLVRTLHTLEAVLVDGGHSPVSVIARSIGIPVATAHRQITTLVEEGYLCTLPNGRRIAGARLLSLLHLIDEKQVIANIAATEMHRLALQTGGIVQLGTFENDMVTYRIKAGRDARTVFTRVGMQLEAYCSGMGKVLLAALPDVALDAYLASGPFPRLTPHTITDPALLRHELMQVRERGYAIDSEEFTEGLHCIAVPIRFAEGTVVAAVSVSQQSGNAAKLSTSQVLELLCRTSNDIEVRLASHLNAPQAVSQDRTEGFAL